MKVEFNNRDQLLEINDLLLGTSESVMKTGNNATYKLNFYILSSINRAISLNNAFVLLADNKNMLTAIPIVRLQFDNAIRLHAVNVAKNKVKFLDDFFKGVPINNFKEEGKRFTDKFLVTQLNEENPGALELYYYLCDFVHFSNKHFLATQRVSEDSNVSFSMEIGNSDILTEEQEIEFYKRMAAISNTIAKKGIEWMNLKNIKHN